MKLLRKQITLLNEPLLEFGFKQRMTDPHSGLSLFGPYDRELPSQPHSIPFALIGTLSGIERFQAFLSMIQKPIISCSYDGQRQGEKDIRLWPPFPGFRAAFDCILPGVPAWTSELDADKVKELAKDLDPHKRAYELVNLYLRAVQVAAERDEGYRVVVCVEPDEIWQYCRPEARVKDGVGTRVTTKEKRIRRYQRDLFLKYDPEQYDLSVDFRRQLKARAMEYDIPIQLIRESTLVLNEENEERGVTRLSDRAWNLSTAFYYKAGGKPWRLSTAREGVCYVGLVFRQANRNTRGQTACCAAQMFLDTGDGVVFRGEFGPWYSPETKEYHLDAKHAEELLSGVIAAYYKQGGKILKEIFLHSRSSILEDEFEGYCRACPKGVKIVGVRVAKTKDELRLYRPGRWCVQRGTIWVINDRTVYLWASGFKRDLLTYDGWEVPVPLRIEVQHGIAPIEQVAEDILGLTKLNYNSCKVGDSEPVTVGFSNKVGEILVSNPTITVRRPSFKFYI